MLPFTDLGGVDEDKTRAMIGDLVDEFGKIGKSRMEFKIYTSRTKGKSSFQTPTTDELTNRLDKLLVDKDLEEQKSRALVIEQNRNTSTVLSDRY